jgi:hypothetical protein
MVMTISSTIRPTAKARSALANSANLMIKGRGARIWPTVRLRPTPSVLDTTKTTTARSEPRIRSSVSSTVANATVSFWCRHTAAMAPSSVI